jgi:hypothetical protein
MCIAMYDIKIDSIEAAKDKSIPNLKKNLIMMGIWIVLIYVVNNIAFSFVPFGITDPTGFFWNFLKYVYQPDRISFLTKDFNACLWVVNLFLFVALFGYFSFLFCSSRRYVKLATALMNLLGILAILVVFLFFPFKIDSILGINIVKTVLIMIIAGTALNMLRILLKHD